MDQSERILDLATYLLSSRRAITSEEIYETFPDAYSGSAESRERKLSRDKEQLRALGFPIVTITIDDEDHGKGIYVDRSAFYMPDVALTPEERAALFAVGSAALGAGLPLHGELAHALTKLRVAHGDDREAATPVVLFPGGRRTEIEKMVTEAVVHRRRLILIYPPETQERRVDPYATSLHHGRFSFVGYCHLRRGIRTFHADRVTACRFAKDASASPEFEVPSNFDPTPHLPVHAWQIRAHKPIEVTIEFSAALAESGPRALGLEPGRPCPATNIDGLLAELLALGEGVRIVSPESARERMRQILRDLQARVNEAA